MNLVEQLAALTPEGLTKIVKEAQKARAKKLAKDIPETDLARLKALHALVEAGEEVKLDLTLPLLLKINIGTEGSNWDFGHVRNWKFSLDESASPAAKLFYKRYFEGTEDVIRNDSSSLETLAPEIAPILDKQTKLFREFDSLRRKLEDTYEFDAWKLLEEGK